ncbi:MAG TPA: AMP-binding protein, partial [Ktedonobacterales bacterium]|nr:AMP-binding protein [Ktedonobacterales bacterium]
HPRLAEYDISSLRLGMAGGAASTPETVRRLTERLGLEALVNGLGSSEAGSVAHTAPGDPPEIHATTCGRPMPWLQTRIVDPATGADQPDGQPGELWIRGPGVMKGYFRNPEATAAALTPDGWLRTGDLLLRGDDGCLRFAGRLKEMFTVGGFNVYPAEVERVLAQHPAVAECQVLGVPDARLGMVPFAFVRYKPDTGSWPADESAPKGVSPQSPPARAGDRADMTSASVSPSPDTVAARPASPLLAAEAGGSPSASASSASSAVPPSSPPSVPSAVNPSLRAFCAERLANYKVPRYFQAVESFPLTGTGKRELRVLHEMAEEIVAATVAEGGRH